MANAIHTARREIVAQLQRSYDDNIWAMIPFTYTGKLTEEKADRIEEAVRAKYPPTHFGGCGTSITKIHVVDLAPLYRKGKGRGWVITDEYHGIGD